MPSPSVPQGHLGKPNGSRSSVLTAAFLTIALGVPAYGQTAQPIEVNTTNDGAATDDSCTPGRQCTLRGAFKRAESATGADTIVLGTGNTFNLTLGQAIVVSSEVTLTSRTCHDDSKECAIDSTTVVDAGTDQNKRARIFEIADGGALTVRAITLTRGDATNATTCLETGLPAGGAICNQAGTLTLDLVTITGSRAGYGGAVHGPATLRNSIVQGNTATFSGGGLSALSGAVRIETSTIGMNTAATYGGGVSVSDQATLDLTRSTLNANVAPAGGGVFLGTSGAVTIANSTVSGNMATTGAGGIHVSCAGCTTGPTLNNVTITANQGGVGGIGVGAGSPMLQIGNSIVAENPDGDCDGGVTSRGHNLFGTSDECGFRTDGGDVSGDPRIAALAFDGDAPGSGIHRPLEQSPALSAGGDDCEQFDQLGHRRRCPTNPVCDIGAVEEFPDGDRDGAGDCYDNCPERPNEDQTDTDLDGVGDRCDDDDLDGDGTRDYCDECANSSSELDQPGLNLTFPDGCTPEQQCSCGGAFVDGGPGKTSACPLDVGPGSDAPEAGARRPFKSRRAWEKCIGKALKKALVNDFDEVEPKEPQRHKCAFVGDTLFEVNRSAWEETRATIEAANPEGECPTKADDDPDLDGVPTGDPRAGGDNCKRIYNPLQRNTDRAWADNDWCDDEGDCREMPAWRKWWGDHRGDWCDPDDDGDNFPDRDDHCRRVPSKKNRDLDGDGCGDVCDGDIDGDGRKNEVDDCPENPNAECAGGSTTTVSTTSTSSSTSSTAP